MTVGELMDILEQYGRDAVVVYSDHSAEYSEYEYHEPRVTSKALWKPYGTDTVMELDALIDSRGHTDDSAPVVSVILG